MNKQGNTMKKQETVQDKELRKEKNLISTKETFKTTTQDEKLTVYDHNQEINKNIDNESINLKEKWSLILSKLELPSTRMLLSQQAELISIQSNMILIGLAPNWENMIKSRSVVIEDAVKKTFGKQMNVSFQSRTNNTSPIINKNQKSNKQNKIQEKFINHSERQNTTQNNNSQITDSKKTSEEIFTDKTLNNEKNSSRNLADFFNGQIIETEQE